MTDSWVSSVGTLTPRKICQEQSSFGGRTPTSTRWRRSDSETTDMWLPVNGKLIVGIDGRNDYRSRTLLLLLGRHRNLVGGSNKGEILGKQRSGSRQKCEVRARNSKAHVDMSINGVFSGWAPFLKSAKSSLG
jgi:hypothetical protein